MTTAANDTQDIILQADFKVLHQALLLIVPGFDVEALVALVTIEMVDAVVLNTKAEYKAN